MSLHGTLGMKIMGHEMLQILRPDCKFLRNSGLTIILLVYGPYCPMPALLCDQRLSNDKIQQSITILHLCCHIPEVQIRKGTAGLKSNFSIYLFFSLF